MKERVTEALTLWSNFNKFVLCFTICFPPFGTQWASLYLSHAFNLTVEFMCHDREEIPDT